ncbi:hypothetical protein LA080_009366 [Diaporthe eres]|nr:hypothetical protein LA080_009366 [Diaporthe eres]
MGKKKDKKRAREAAAAAAAAGSQNRTSEGAPAVSNVSQPDQPMAPFPGSTQGHHQDTASPSNQSWTAVNTAMAASGFSGGPAYPMPQAMNGLQNFSLPILQLNLFQNQLFANMYGIGMGMGMGNMAFSTMQPNMFPGQPPAPAFGQYELAQTGMGAPGHETLRDEDSSSAIPRRKSQRAAAAAANVAIANEIANGPSTASPRSSSKNGRAAITAPSKASGGVPNPTPSYLARASFLPQRRAEPGPLLVVIDLNGTILFRPDRRKSHSFRRRPHADTFVSYCVETFWVVFWSSARPENVRRMVETLVSPAQLDKVVALWGRDRFGLTPEDYNARTQCYKRLTALWDDPVVRASFPADRPGYEGKCWDQGNTVLIDDSVEKARSEPHNAITIPEFTGDMNESLDILPKVHDYLNELCFQEDVSTHVRANPFKMA